MSVITAYKCDTTGRLFEDKAKYTKHIRKIAADRRAERKIEQAHRTDQQWWADNFWNRVRSIDQLEAAILHHSDVFAARGVKDYFNSGRSKLKPTPVIKFTTFHLKYSSHVSNSHNCPHNGVTCWSSHEAKDGRPTGYPGWHGRFDYVVQSHKGQTGCYPGSSDMWKSTRIHSGSGGGGGYRDQEKNFLQSFGFSFSLFAADWPAMAEAYDKARVWAELQGKPNYNLDQLVNEMNPASAYFEVDTAAELCYN